MASITDTSLTFFSKATPSQWSFVLNLYRDVFKTHAEQTRGSRKNGPADLIKLDIWFQEQLPQLIRSRKEHQLFYEELVQITKWKLLRGKFRPSLLDLVKTNTETSVKNVTKKAFRKLSLPNITVPNISAAISALTQLKGIGPSTASAILVAYSPDNVPYMADETMLSIIEVTDYTLAEFLNYVEKIQECVDRLRVQDLDGDWTSHKVELALWTHYQIKQYNLSLLDSMPLASEFVNSTMNEISIENQPSSDDLNKNECDPTSNSDENQVDSSLNYEIDQVNSNSNSNLIDSIHSNSVNNDEASQNCIEIVTQSDSESASNGLSSTKRDMNANVESNAECNQVSNSESNLDHEEVSNLSSVISSNSLDESLQSNKVVGVVEEEDSSSSNNVSSTNLNGISQSTSKSTEHHKANRLCDHLAVIANGKASPTNNGDNQINSSLIKQQLVDLHTQNNNVDSNLSLPNTNDSSEKFSTISSSCENSNNVNSSEDSILHLNHKKRSNSSSSGSLSNLGKQPRICVNNCSDALDLDDNAVPDTESLSKRQKLIN